MARRLGIKRKLIGMLLLTSGIVLAITCAAFIVYDYYSFRKVSIGRLDMVGRIIAANTSAALAFDDAEDATETLSALAAERSIVRACLYDRRGRIFATHPRGLGRGEFPRVGPVGLRLHGARFEGFLPVRQEDSTRVGTLYIESGGEVLFERFQRYGAIVLVVFALVLPAAYVLATLLQGHISRPILALTETARSVSEARDFSVRAQRTTDDELGELTDAFNQMLTELGEQTEAVTTLNFELEKRVSDRTAELEATAAELESFSYSVSHDLRAPLRHVQGYVEMLTSEAAGQLGDKARRYLNTIAEATREMGQLIDDLLAFSRVARVELRRGRVPLDALVGDVIRAAQPSIADRDVRWTVSPLPDVSGDAAVLKQVFVNLIDNALKYSRGREPAEIEIGSCGYEAEHAVLFVRDNGAGFDMRYAHKLFGVFQRLHRSEEFEGTGIGLATVQRIVIRHGGRVWAKSEIGKGAIFYLTLPLFDETTNRGDHVDVEPDSARGRQPARHGDGAGGARSASFGQ